PARRGHSALVLFPFGPWQAVQTALFVAPSWALPVEKGSGAALVCADVSVVASRATAAQLALIVFTIVLFPLRPVVRRRGIVHYGREQISTGPFSSQRRGTRAISPRPGRGGRICRPLECRQVEPHQRDHPTQGPGAHEQDAGTHPPPQFLRAGSGAADRGPAGLRVCDRPRGGAPGVAATHRCTQDAAVTSGSFHDCRFAPWPD